MVDPFYIACGVLAVGWHVVVYSALAYDWRRTCRLRRAKCLPVTGDDYRRRFFWSAVIFGIATVWPAAIVGAVVWALFYYMPVLTILYIGVFWAARYLPNKPEHV